MEPVEERHQTPTRDSESLDLDVLIREDSICQREESLEERGATRTMAIKTKGLFHFMELPPEVRVQVRSLAKHFAGIPKSLLYDVDTQ
jgi:hypothetical protein